MALTQSNEAPPEAVQSSALAAAQAPSPKLERYPFPYRREYTFQSAGDAQVTADMLATDNPDLKWKILGLVWESGELGIGEVLQINVSGSRIVIQAYGSSALAGERKLSLGTSRKIVALETYFATLTE